MNIDDTIYDESDDARLTSRASAVSNFCQLVRRMGENFQFHGESGAKFAVSDTITVTGRSKSTNALAQTRVNSTISS